MPTLRSRHSVTETDDVARALDDAARLWPQDRDNRARLLLRLVAEGHRAVIGEREADAQHRREAVAQTAGAMTGVYPPGQLEELRRDWPE